MSKVLVNYNPSAQVATYLHEDDEGNVTVEKVIDETQKFSDNQSLKNMTSSLDRWGDGRMVLRGVPFDLIQDWKKRGWFTKEQFYRCLSDERAAPYKIFVKA